MEKLNKDVLVLLALELDTPSLMKFCESDKNINVKVCGNENFWYKKIVKEFPEPWYDEYKNPSKEKEESFKDKYIQLYNGKNILNIPTKGKLRKKLVGYNRLINIKPEFAEFFKNIDLGNVGNISLKSVIIPLLEARILNIVLLTYLFKYYAMKNKLLFKSNDTGYWFVPDDLMRKYFNYWFTENKGLDHETMGKIYFFKQYYP